MTSPTRRAGAGQRGVAMVATISVHLALLLMMLWGGGVRPDADPTTTALAVFDVAPPPPPPEPVPPKRVRMEVGGSAGRARTRPRAAIVRAPTPPPRRADMLAADVPLAVPARQAARPDLLVLPDMAAGSGGGSERGGAGGEGDGRGGGAGSGDAVGLTRALWIRMPSVAEMEPYLPIRARRERIAGRVILACIVPRPGPPRRCTVVSEQPAGMGFGASALRISRMFRMKPAMRGSAVEKLPVIVPMRFDLPIDVTLPTRAG